MAKPKRKGSYDKEREKAKRKAGIKQIVVSVPDLAAGLGEGAVGEGAYIRVDVMLPRWKNKSIYRQFFTVNRARRRIELATDFSLLTDDFERIIAKPAIEIEDEKFLAKVVTLPAEYRSRERSERDLEKVAGLLAMTPDDHGTIARVLTLQEQAEQEEAAAQTAVTQPAQTAVTQPAQEASSQDS